MKLKQWISTAGMFIIPLQVLAHPLTITNQTSTPISFAVNSVCYQKFGVVEKGGQKVISEQELNEACNNFASECRISGFDAANCGGYSLGGIRYTSEHHFDVLSASDSNTSITVTESTLSYTDHLTRK